MGRFLPVATIALMMALSVPAFAGATATGDSLRLEATALAVERELIAPCCWHQSVAVHSSPIATQMKAEIRAALREGNTPDEIKARYIAQYGERILTVPPRSGFNYTLWAIPFAATIGAAGVASHFLRRWRRGERNDRARTAPAAASNSAALRKVDEELRKWEE